VRRQSGAATALWLVAAKVTLLKAVSRSACHRTPKESESRKPVTHLDRGRTSSSIPVTSETKATSSPRPMTQIDVTNKASVPLSLSKEQKEKPIRPIATVNQAKTRRQKAKLFRIEDFIGARIVAQKFSFHKKMATNRFDKNANKSVAASPCRI
jgi:hypothetical protein